MIGMFAVSELLRGIVAIDRHGVALTQKIGNIFVGVWKVWKRYWLNFHSRLGDRRPAGPPAPPA